MAKKANPKHPQTFLDHLMELRQRLFWVMVTVLVGAGVGYLISDFIINLLLHPLNNQPLIYTSPAGGFEFLFKICLFFGFLISVPVLVYHIIRFIEPVLVKQSFRFIVALLVASASLMVAGGAFAYFIGLPAALHFLTQFSSEQIQALLSTNEYMSFVMIYIAGFALLFQIPLLLLFINRITPLKPGWLMGYQRIVIVGSFVVAALITPTPDPVNQTLMAAPIIFLYQGGIGLVWLANRRSHTYRVLLPPTDNSNRSTERSRADLLAASVKVAVEPSGNLQPAVLDLSKLEHRRSSSLFVSVNILDLRR